MGQNKSDFIINSLIYPLPNRNNSGLGIHITKDISGRIKLGPNAIKLGEKLLFNYEVNLDSKKHFFKEVKAYLPKLKFDNLYPDQVGIRPKLANSSKSQKDFIIKNEKDLGYNNFINLLGIESPGLTSSLAIGKYVSKLIEI